MTAICRKYISIMPGVMSLVALVISLNISIFGGKATASDKTLDTWIPEEYVGYCEEISDMYGISPELLEAIIEKESSGVADVVNPKYNCTGLMQINPTIHADRMKKLGVTNLKDPYSNILVGADYLTELFEKYGDTYPVLSEYGGWDSIDGNEYMDEVLERAHLLEIVHMKIPEGDG